MYGGLMIKVRRFNDTELVVNADLIEFIEATPDTVISMTTGKKIMLRDSVDEIVAMVVDYRRRCLAPAGKLKNSKKK